MKQAHTVRLFNDKELSYLRLRYQGINKDTIVEKLQLKNKKECAEIEKLILNKLSVNNLYNAYRLAFNLELLNREDFMMADIKKEASKFSEKITKILLSTKISDEEKELEVYLILLVFQMKIEYSYLFKKGGKDTVLQIV
ncbi:hypothetical protein [Flavivirga eckloniae]|uniref:Uncharacterized protein n=1 Tax=Flavivirga eckloniae TaxID=1803846 RepID=A0A2K9PW04_9FLAO|nr:hypothetical protein [Flavivirga eckloniae]AUP81233.1 hypothetical protein C1H87_21950 [Flavivirga eckloniae]